MKIQTGTLASLTRAASKRARRGRADTDLVVSHGGQRFARRILRGMTAQFRAKKMDLAAPLDDSGLFSEDEVVVEADDSGDDQDCSSDEAVCHTSSSSDDDGPCDDDYTVAPNVFDLIAENECERAVDQRVDRSAFLARFALRRALKSGEHSEEQLDEFRRRHNSAARIQSKRHNWRAIASSRLLRATLRATPC